MTQTYTIHSKLEALDIYKAIETRENQLKKEMKSNDESPKIYNEMNRLSIAKTKFKEVIDKKGYSAHYEKFNGLL